MMGTTIPTRSIRLSWWTAMAAVLCLALAGPATAKKVGKATVPDSMTVAGTELPLRGAGLRTRAVFKLYAAALYTTETGDAAAVVSADAPMAIHLHILSKLVSNDKMIDALNDGFNNATGGDTSSIQAEIDQMIAAMDEPLKPGVGYTLSYEPGVGTTLSRDGEAAAVIEGLAFKQALFGIWLGDKPAQAKLKTAMLSNA